MTEPRTTVDGPELAVIVWPYHDGRRDVGMGRGASVLARDQRLRRAVASIGWQMSIEEVAPVDESGPEIARVVELDRRLAERVRAARHRGSFPLVLAGNCNSCLGTVAGVGLGGLGVVWFDAHADFDTPEDNLSGFFDVMALSILTGTGWAALRQTIPGFAPVPERDVVLAGVRDLEPYQRARLEASEIRTVSGRVDRGELCAHLDGLRRGVDRAYLHVDLDVLDIGVGRANQYAAAGGPTLEAMILAIDAVFERLTIEAAAVTAYDPQLDPDRRVATASCRVIAAIARRALNQTCTRTPTDPSGPDPQLDVHP